VVAVASSAGDALAHGDALARPGCDVRELLAGCRLALCGLRQLLATRAGVCAPAPCAARARDSLLALPRVARNEVSQQVVAAEREGKPFEAVADLVKGVRGREGLASGDTDHGIWSAGMVQGLIHDIPTCAELITRIVADAEAIMRQRFQSMLTDLLWKMRSKVRASSSSTSSTSVRSPRVWERAAARARRR
jgi:hypothetical protein